MNIQIRPMTIADIATIHKMGQEEEGFRVAESEDSCFWSKEQLERWVRAGEDVLLVAEVDGEIAGFVLTTLHRPTGKATWENELVAPKFRGQGIGRTLDEEMVQHLRANGATYIHFLVKAENPNLPHYENSGFERGREWVWFGKHL